MHARRPSRPAAQPLPAARSRAALLAVIAWWLAIVLAIIAWRSLNAAMGEGGSDSLGQSGTWLTGFAALAAVTGWGCAIGSLLRDRGRVRVGALLLMALPLVTAVFGYFAVSSTVVNPDDPLAAVWMVVCGILLVFATLLIMVPSHLGID